MLYARGTAVVLRLETDKRHTINIININTTRYFSMSGMYW